MISVIKTRKIWFVLSGGLVALSIILSLIWGLDLGIDFTGGSLMEISFKNESPKIDEITKIINEAGFDQNSSVQPIGEKGFIIRTKDLTEDDHQKILGKFNESYKDNFQEERFDSIGPNIGEELKQKTYKAVFFGIIGIIVYIAWAFRKVSKPVSSWKYGIIAALVLFHDVIITVGFFSVFGKFYKMEVNAPFIAALLTILGYSVNDTIVIFDRIRENVMRYYEGNLGPIIDKSVNETMVRSINTTFTVILTLLAILIFGGSTIRDFALALIIGITVGSYSSIFLASPLLLVAEKINFGNKTKKVR